MITLAIALAAGAIAALAIATLVLPRTAQARFVALSTVPANELFSFMTAVDNAPKWIPGCTAAEKLAGRDGPARRQALVIAGARHEQQVTTWIANRQYGWKETPAAGPLGEARAIVTLNDRAGKTEIEVLGEFTARNPLARWALLLGEAGRQKAFSEGLLASLAAFSPSR